MNTNATLLIVGNTKAYVTYKDVKNLHLSVLPPEGKIRVTAPLDTKEDVIRVFLASKTTWIRNQRQKYQDQRRETKREYVSGETHYYLGKAHKLTVHDTATKLDLELSGKNKMVLSVRPETSTDKKEEIVTEWYRAKLKEVLDMLVKKWQKKLPVKPNHFRIQRMKTRWGSCNHERKRVLLNLELIKKPHHCIEYVLVHEWLHIIEPKHNDSFVKLLDKYLPKWRQAKDELNRFILTYEEWDN